MGLAGCRLILYFFIYSFLGWCVESTICSVHEGRLINRGFLNGPICPVYGCGGMAVIYLLTPVQENLVLLYICGVLVVSVIEYFTGWILETLFHTRWWDYSHYRFNIKGRVCLPNALFFGVLAVLAMKGIHPAVSREVEKLSMIPLVWLASAGTTLFSVDLVLSVRAALTLSGKLDALQKTLAEIQERTEAAIAEKRLHAALFRSMTPAERLDALLPGAESAKLRQRLEKLTRSGFMHRRMLNAFPHMQFPQSPSTLAELKAAIERIRTEKKARKNAGK